MGRPVTDPVLLDEVRFVIVGGCLSNDAALGRDAEGGWVDPG